MRFAEIVGAVVLAALSGYMMWKSGTSAWGDGWGDPIRFVEGEGPGSGWWPFYLSLAMLVCCGWIVVNAVRGTSPPSQSTEPFLDGEGVRLLVKVGGGVVGFVALIPIVGMYGAMFVFLVYYIGLIGRHGLVLTLAISVAAPVITFFFFDVAMRIVLPKGYLEPLFIPLYAIFL